MVTLSFYGTATTCSDKYNYSKYYGILLVVGSLSVTKNKPSPYNISDLRQLWGVGANHGEQGEYFMQITRRSCMQPVHSKEVSLSRL
jgi:hypothetical protein